MAMSLNALKKLTKEEWSNMMLVDQNKFNNMLSIINTELISLKDRFKKMESELLVTRWYFVGKWKMKKYGCIKFNLSRLMRPINLYMKKVLEN